MSKSKKEKPKPFVPEFLRDAVNARMDDQEAMLALPQLLDALLPVYEGSALIRQAGKLTIKPEGAHWIVQVDCPTEVLVGRIVCSTLGECLSSLNAAIGNRTVVWSPGWSKSKKALPTVDELIK